MNDEEMTDVEDAEMGNSDPGEVAAQQQPGDYDEGGDGRIEDAQAVFRNIDSNGSTGRPKRQDELNLDVILDVPVTVAMEIGRTKISIRNLLQMNEGSVIELDRLAGEPMDLLVNGTLIAQGEVVVVNDKFGIRLTDVISPAERVKKLK
ncbi:MAG: flagellar motor switch protein FliN [Pseudomonadota bacterium]